MRYWDRMGWSGKGSIFNSVMTEWTPEGQADQTPKSLGCGSLDIYGKLSSSMKMRFSLVLERPEVILKRCRPKSFSAGPPAPLDLAFPWISITGKEMLISRMGNLTIRKKNY